MTLISRETKGPWMCVPLSQPNKARRALTSSAESTAGAGLAGTETIGGWCLFIVARVINHSWKLNDKKWSRWKRRYCVKRTKVQLRLLLFTPQRKKPRAIVTSNRRSLIVTVVTFEPSIGSFERQIQLNWMSVYCSTQSLISLDFAKGCDSPQLWIFQHAALLCWWWVVI